MEPFSSLRPLKKIRRVMANGYRNWYYGTRDKPSSLIGIPALALFPGARAFIAAGMRHLPRKGKERKLLDIGCGNGLFLLHARSAGWKVMGLEFDLKALEVARSRGLEVLRENLALLDPEKYAFDVITLGHVIEHVHNPCLLLKACHDHLNPGGWIWIETPNIDAQGHRMYGKNWRGLEPPRHLVLFSLESLKRTLQEAGFVNVELQPYRPVCDEIFRASRKIADENGGVFGTQRRVAFGPVRKAERAARRSPALREFITVKAWKGA